MTDFMAWRPMHPTAIRLEDLSPVEQIDMTGPLLIAIIVCLLVAAAAIVAIWLLSRAGGRRPAAAPRRGVHASDTSRTVWRERIDAITVRYHAGEMNREDAMVALAEIARLFASQTTGRDMSSRTLLDLKELPRSSGAAGTTETSGSRPAAGVDLLRQTIEALYPPEFADAGINRSAGRIDVDEAAGWVSNLVERWR